MALLKFLKKTKKEFDKKVEILDAPAGAGAKDPIWKLRTINDIIIAMCNRMTSKTNYGENMEVLTEEERVFYVATEIDSQVHSLGFDQFFFDEAGKFAAEAPNALRKMGAEERAQVAEKAEKVAEKAAEVKEEIKDSLTDGIEDRNQKARNSYELRACFFAKKKPT